MQAGEIPPSSPLINPISRDFSIDFIRVTAIFFVLVLHISEAVTNHWGKVPFFDWMSGNFYNSLSRFCVPVLFMVSGFLLLDKEESLKVFYTKRLQKILIPLLAWSVVYLLLSQDYSNFTFFNALKSMVKAILSGPVYFHLWFLYVLIALYLIVPLLRKFVKYASVRKIGIITLLCFLLILVIMPLDDYLSLKPGITIKAFPTYIGFFLAGYLIKKVVDVKKVAGISLVGLIISTSFTIQLTLLATQSADRLIGRYYGYTTINVVIASLCSFISLKWIGELIAAKSKPWFIQLMAVLSEASLGIYLLHIIVIFWLRDGSLGFTLQVFTFQPIFAVPLTAFITFLISFAIIYPSQKIPILREAV